MQQRSWEHTSRSRHKGSQKGSIAWFFRKLRRQLGARESTAAAEPGKSKTQGKEHLEVYFANYTQWGVKAKSRFEDEHLQGVQVHMGAEHHLQGGSLGKAEKQLKQRGWTTMATPAAATDNGGTTGGTWVLFQRHLGGRRLEAPGDEGAWTFTVLRLRGLDLVLVAGYLTVGVGLQGNWESLQQLMSILGALKCSFLVAADWNMEPKELRESGVETYLKGVIKPPTNTKYTCKQGRGRMLDYVLVSKDLADLVEVTADMDGGWTPHLGLHIRLARQIWQRFELANKKPKEIPRCAGPRSRAWGNFANPGPDPAGLKAPVREGSCSALGTLLYRQFSERAESYLLDTTGKQGIEEEAYRGRGQPLCLQLRPVLQGNREASHWRNPVMNYLGRLQGALRDWHIKATRARLSPAWKVKAKEAGDKAKDLAQQLHRMLGEGYEGHQEQVQALQGMISSSSSPGEVGEGLKELDKWIRRAQVNMHKDARKDLQAWVEKHLQKGARALHMVTKAAGHDNTKLPGVTVAGLAGTGTGMHETRRMELKKDFWANIWSPFGEGGEEDPPWLFRLRAEAGAEEPEGIAMDRLLDALGRSPPAAGTGGDHWRAREWAELPLEGKAELKVILELVEETLRWPEQALVQVVALQDKPSGGDRPIALTSALYRTWGRLRGHRVQGWDAAKAGFWDAAVAGNDPLKEAVMREMLSEAAVACGHHVGQLAFDQAKCYDHIPPEKVVSTGLKLGFPPKILYLGILAHRSARVVTLDGASSQPVVPQRSLLAGCFQSVSWTRLYFYELLDEAHRKLQGTFVRTWVDDTTSTTRGPTEGFVVEQTVRAGCLLAKGLVDLGGKINFDKTFLQASSTRLGKAIQAELKKEGVAIRLAITIRDLGCDATLGKRRRLTTFKERGSKAAARMARIGWLVRVHKGCRKLVQTGAKPQLGWGHQMKDEGCFTDHSGAPQDQVGQGRGHQVCRRVSNNSLGHLSGEQGRPRILLQGTTSPHIPASGEEHDRMAGGHPHQGLGGAEGKVEWRDQVEQSSRTSWGDFVHFERPGMGRSDPICLEGPWGYHLGAGG